MVAPRFYIFGVPDGFDMLEGTRQEISYFQRFYDGSTEDTKFTLHRDSNGNVTYTFLKYNLSSGKSRTGSFFGMSLAFSGVYCNHPLRLYELFDYVYQNHVLCNTSDASKGILKPIANSDIKAQYLITRFEDRKEHINFVEKVFQYNLATDDMLTSSFYPLDPGFKNENQNLVVKLPLVVEFEDEKRREPYRVRFEESLIGCFREYSYVTISPDWKPKPIDNSKPGPDVEIAPQKIVQWKDLIPAYQRYIIQGLGNLAATVLDEVKRYQKQTEEILGQLKNYSYNKNIAPSIQSNYEELCNQLADLYQKAADAQNGGGAPLPPPPPDPIPPKPTPIPSFWERAKEWVAENKSKIAGIVGAVAVLVVVLVLIRSKKEEPSPNKPSYCELVSDSIQNKLSENRFKEANEIAQRIPDSLECKNDNINLVYDKQSCFLDEEINQLMANKKWKEAFDKAGEYFDENAKKEKKAKIQEECYDYFDKEIDKVNADNYSSMSSRIMEELKDVKGDSYIGDENYKKLEKKLSNKNPKLIEDPKPKTSTYVVEFYKTNSSYVRISDIPTKTFTSAGTQSTNEIKVGEDHYIYEIKKDGNKLKGTELANVVQNRSHNEVCNPKDTEIRLWLQTINEGSFEVGNMKIKVTK